MGKVCNHRHAGHMAANACEDSSRLMEQPMSGATCVLRLALAPLQWQCFLKFPMHRATMHVCSLSSAEHDHKLAPCSDPSAPKPLLSHLGSRCLRLTSTNAAENTSTDTTFLSNFRMATSNRSILRDNSSSVVVQHWCRDTLTRTMPGILTHCCPSYSQH